MVTSARAQVHAEKQTGKLTFSETDTRLAELDVVRKRTGLRSKDQAARLVFRVGLMAITAFFKEVGE